MDIPLLFSQTSMLSASICMFVPLYTLTIAICLTNLLQDERPVSAVVNLTDLVIELLADCLQGHSGR